MSIFCYSGWAATASDRQLPYYSYYSRRSECLRVGASVERWNNHSREMEFPSCRKVRGCRSRSLCQWPTHWSHFRELQKLNDPSSNMHPADLHRPFAQFRRECCCRGPGYRRIPSFQHLRGNAPAIGPGSVEPLRSRFQDADPFASLWNFWGFPGACCSGVGWVLSVSFAMNFLPFAPKKKKKKSFLKD
jgi:hypothetical protein